jgi:hypothetical protein
MNKGETSRPGSRVLGLIIKEFIGQSKKDGFTQNQISSDSFKHVSDKITLGGVLRMTLE